jgi:hypothetical protein
MRTEVIMLGVLRGGKVVERSFKTDLWVLAPASQ